VIKVTVWTSGYGAEYRPKCIFKGNIPALPRIGEHVDIAYGFASELVTSVTHELASGTVEISVRTVDRGNQYKEV